jgi:hypothetical protein
LDIYKFDPWDLPSKLETYIFHVTYPILANRLECN